MRSGVREALLAGRGIGVARVDHDGPNVVGGQVLAAPLHRRGTDAIGRERSAAAHGPSAASTAMSSARRLQARRDATGAKPRGMSSVAPSLIKIDSWVRLPAGKLARGPDTAAMRTGSGRSSGRVAAVDEQGRAGHEARCVGRQEHRGRPQLDRVAPAGHGTLASIARGRPGRSRAAC